LKALHVTEAPGIAFPAHDTREQTGDAVECSKDENRIMIALSQLAFTFHNQLARAVAARGRHV